MYIYTSVLIENNNKTLQYAASTRVSGETAFDISASTNGQFKYLYQCVCIYIYTTLRFWYVYIGISQYTSLYIYIDASILIENNNRTLRYTGPRFVFVPTAFPDIALASGVLSPILLPDSSTVLTVAKLPLPGCHAIGKPCIRNTVTFIDFLFPLRLKGINMKTMYMQYTSQIYWFPVSFKTKRNTIVRNWETMYMKYAQIYRFSS